MLCPGQEFSITRRQVHGLTLDCAVASSACFRLWRRHNPSWHPVGTSPIRVHCTRRASGMPSRSPWPMPVEGTLVFGLTIDSSGQLKTSICFWDIDPPLGQRALDIMAQFTEWSVAIPEGQLEEVRWTLPVSLAPVDRGSGFQVSWGWNTGRPSPCLIGSTVLLPILVMDPSDTQPPAEAGGTRYQREKGSARGDRRLG